MIFLNQPRDFLLRDLAPNVSFGRINQELRHAQMIDILQADGDAPIARPLPDLWVGVVFELGKDIPCGFRRTYSFILSCHTQTLSSLSNDMHTHFRNVPFQYVARKGTICRFASHSSFAFWAIVYQNPVVRRTLFSTRLHNQFLSPDVRDVYTHHRRHAPPVQFGIGPASHPPKWRPRFPAEDLATRPKRIPCTPGMGPVRTTFAV